MVLIIYMREEAADDSLHLIRSAGYFEFTCWTRVIILHI